MDKNIPIFFHNLYYKSKNTVIVVDANLTVIYVTNNFVQALGYGSSLPLNVETIIGKKNSFLVKECVIEQTVNSFTIQEGNQRFSVTITPFTIDNATFASLSYTKIEQPAGENDLDALYTNLRRSSEIINNYASLISSAGQLINSSNEAELSNLIVKYSKCIKRATTHFDIITGLSHISSFKIFVNMPLFLSAVVEKLQKSIVQHDNIKFGYSCSCDIFYSQISVIAIESVIGNIISNSVRFCYNDPVINMTAYEQDEMFCIKISDNGMAIKKENLDMIFEQGYSTYSSSGVVGQGLGLSVVKQIIHEHNGEIFVESDGKEGTEVTIKFRRAQGECDLLFKEDFFMEDIDDTFSILNIELADI